MRRSISIVMAIAAGSLPFAPVASEADGCCDAPVVLAQASGPTTPARKTLQVAIEGMTCGGCAAGINGTLSRLEGVQKTDITFEKKGGTVVYDSAKIDENKIIAAINETGFKAVKAK